MGNKCSTNAFNELVNEAEPPRRPRQAAPRQDSSNRRFSLFRVGSQVRQMSTYNHVQDAVSYNMAVACSDRPQETVPPGVIGLRNLGNTCFMNSSLQCLSNTIPLTDYFLGYDYRRELNRANVLGTGGRLATAYAELMKQMWLESNHQHGALKPSKFKHRLATFCPQFEGRHQHDAQELLAYLLDGIHEDLNRVKQKPYIEDKDCDGSNDAKDAVEAWKNYLKRNKSLIVDIFQGQFRNTCQCKQCGHVNIRFEPFMYLSLPISDSCTTLQDCLNLYLEMDTLDGPNQWYCGKCQQHVDATRKIDIWILPPILIIHLKRFKYDDYGHVGSKNNVMLEYPMERWDLSTTVLGQGKEHVHYDLYAVSNHIGGLASGHYTAHALNRFDDEWYEFNDSSCRPLRNVCDIQKSSSAYLLFYNRSEDDEDDFALSSSSRRSPLIRRQSVSRPDLWPHAQVVDADFRDFRRSSRRLSIDGSKSKSLDEMEESMKSVRLDSVPMEKITEGTKESSEFMLDESNGKLPAATAVDDEDDKKVAAKPKTKRRRKKASTTDNNGKKSTSSSTKRRKRRKKFQEKRDEVL